MNDNGLIEIQLNNQKSDAPYNIEIEVAVLGGILLNNDILREHETELHPDYFYEPANKYLFNIISEYVIINNNAIDQSIVRQYVDYKYTLFEKLGGQKYLYGLISHGYALVKPHVYIKFLKQLYTRRSLIEIADEMKNEAVKFSQFEVDPTNVIENAEQKLYQLGLNNLAKTKSYTNIAEAAHHTLADFDHYLKNNLDMLGTPTGFIDLDNHIGGFNDSDLIILAARPGMGKTSLALNMAYNMAKYYKDNDSKKSVGIISLEMPNNQLTQRMMATQGEVDLKCLRSLRQVNNDIYERLRKASEEISKLPIYLDDDVNTTIDSIRSNARRMKRENNVGVLFVDYLQLIYSMKSNENRTQEITKITSELKAIAKELNIPVVALSQLSREVERRDDKRPMLSDLRDSGAIEQNADIVTFLFREEYYLKNKNTESKSDIALAESQQRLSKVANQAELIVSKNRHGPTGSIKLHFASQNVKFSNLQR